jgi:hypothetical protein
VQVRGAAEHDVRFQAGLVIGVALRALHGGELPLAKELVAVAEHHSAEHEIHYVALDLARWSEQHHRQVAEAGRHHGLELEGSSEPASRRLVPARPTTPPMHSAMRRSRASRSCATYADGIRRGQ